MHADKRPFQLKIALPRQKNIYKLNILRDFPVATKGLGRQSAYQGAYFSQYDR